MNTPRIWIGLLLTAALHLALLYAFLLTPRQPPVKYRDAKAPEIQWLKLTPLAPSPPASLVPAKPPPPPVPPPQQLAPPKAKATPIPETPPAPAPVSADVLDEKMDEESREPLDTPQAPPEKTFADIHATVLPNWHGAGSMEEISIPGTNGTRMFRITTSIGIHCVAYLPNGGAMKIIDCPRQ